MQWNEIYPGAVVYHKIYTHWGKGVVEKVVSTMGLEAMFERGSRRAIVKFEHEDGVARCNASALRPTPNKKKIREMVKLYQERGVDAKDGGDRLIIPSRGEKTMSSENGMPATRVDDVVRRPCRGDELPAKFSKEERAAYQWLHDCDIRPWMVDFITKKVTTLEGDFSSLVAFARHHGMS